MSAAYDPSTAAPVPLTQGRLEKSGSNGKDLEKVWPEGVKALRKLVYDYEAQVSIARREQLRRIRRAREFWKGAQYLFLDKTSDRWKVPGLDALSQKESDLVPRYDFITNFYQAYGLTLISILTQGNPVTRWLPDDPQNQTDVLTSRAASDVAQLFRRNNPITRILQDLMFYFFNDGGVGAYVRYVADPLKYGVDQKPRTQLVTQEGDPIATCPTCHWQGPVPPPGQPMQCPKCGLPLDPANVQPGQPAEIVRPVIGQDGQPVMDETPRGQEVLELVSFLNLVVPVYSQEQDTFPFLTHADYYHRARIVATYPWVEDKLAEGNESQGSSAQAYEKQTTTTLLESSSQSSRGGTELSDILKPLRRTWFRPWALYGVKDKGLRSELQAEFKSGVKVAFAGNAYCEASEESMDDHWKVTHAFPGEGQNREAVGGSLLDVQRRHNAIENITIETAEFGIPTLFADSETLNINAYREAGALPGLVMPVLAPDGGAIATKFYQTEPARLAEWIPGYERGLMMDKAQFLVGAFPALFGGDTGGNDTARGISEQRDQSLGRIGMYWRTIVEFLAGCDELAVKSFAEGRPDDVKLTIEGPASTLNAKLIRLDDLKGNVRAYPDPTEVYPITFEKKRQAVQTLAENPNPSFMALFNRPGNLEAFLRYNGMADEIEIPGAAERDAELRVIARVMQDGPAAAPQVDPIMDDAKIIIATIREWAASDAGEDARQTNPEVWGFLKMRVQQCAAIIQAQTPPPPPPGKPGAPPPSGPPPDEQPAGAPPVQ